MDDNRVEELARKVKAAQDAYYNLDPQMTDQEYDALVDELKHVRPEHPVVTAIGAPAPQLSVWEKVAHEIPMGSLNKANSEPEFSEWAGKTRADTFFMTHKIDGSSMELVYKAGKLVRCVTRGDGQIGEDVTANISRVLSVPKKLPIAVDAIVRGEIVMFKSVFMEKYAEEYANPRNTAAGKVRDKKKSGEDCENLEFLAYWVAVQDRPKTMFFMFRWLANHGFKVPDASAGELDAIKNDYARVVKERDSVPYEIDGVVISVNDIEQLEALGDHGMRPRGQIAWKFDAAMGVTRVVEVRWQNGTGGRVTPVASVEPVNVGGVSITSVSLHNLALFRDLALFRGCRVLVSRRNDVIPYIEKNLDVEVG